MVKSNLHHYLFLHAAGNPHVSKVTVYEKREVCQETNFSLIIQITIAILARHQNLPQNNRQKPLLHP
ncbi:MAG: hypothetical protein K2P13_00215, partial [Lachnospiraceae bacterium]|nr:hypothetical protein [Lachnospiraceae bacterium]